jgi:hypothetical protein
MSYSCWVNYTHCFGRRISHRVLCCNFVHFHPLLPQMLSVYTLPFV